MARLLAGKSASFPVKLEQNKTYTFLVETVGDEMRASIDGQAVEYLKSPGIGHLTKSKIELGVAGQSGWFEDIKVWNAEPVRKEDWPSLALGPLIARRGVCSRWFLRCPCLESRRNLHAMGRGHRDVRF